MQKVCSAHRTNDSGVRIACKFTAFFLTDQRISRIKYYKYQIMIILQSGDYHLGLNTYSIPTSAKVIPLCSDEAENK